MSGRGSTGPRGTRGPAPLPATRPAGTLAPAIGVEEFRERFVEELEDFGGGFAPWAGGLALGVPDARADRLGHADDGRQTLEAQADWADAVGPGER